MDLKHSIDLVLNEAETSALGDNNQDILDAVIMLKDFFSWINDDINAYDYYMRKGYKLSSISNDQDKMADFVELSKSEFLEKHPFTSEQEYNTIRSEQEQQN